MMMKEDHLCLSFISKHLNSSLFIYLVFFLPLAFTNAQQSKQEGYIVLNTTKYVLQTRKEKEKSTEDQELLVSK